MLLAEIKPLNERLIPSSKPVDYTWHIDNGRITTGWLKTSQNQEVEISFQDAIAAKITPLAQKLFSPDVLKDKEHLNDFWEIGFDTKIDNEEQDGFRNHGDFRKGAFKILSTVAYAVHDLFYLKRSKINFAFFWCREGENKDELYAKLADELTQRIKNYGYIRVKPHYFTYGVTFGREDSYHGWIKRSVFKDVKVAMAEHPEAFVK